MADIEDTIQNLTFGIMRKRRVIPRGRSIRKEDNVVVCDQRNS